MEKILEISRCKDKHRSCNVCGNEIHKGRCHVVHELNFGKNNQNISIAICSDCLNEFADNLWKYLEEDK